MMFEISEKLFGDDSGKDSSMGFDLFLFIFFELLKFFHLNVILMLHFLVLVFIQHRTYFVSFYFLIFRTV